MSPFSSRAGSIFTQSILPLGPWISLENTHTSTVNKQRWKWKEETKLSSIWAYQLNMAEHLHFLISLNLISYPEQLTNVPTVRQRQLWQKSQPNIMTLIDKRHLLFSGRIDQLQWLIDLQKRRVTCELQWDIWWWYSPTELRNIYRFDRPTRNLQSLFYVK